MSTGLNILSIDAKDIYISNHYIKDNGNTVGYNILTKQGNINTKKFINVLDYSLDLIKLREVYESVYRNTRFSFNQDGHSFTTEVVNVTFKYSNKEFNRIRKDTYVKFGYCLDDLQFIDCACIIDNELIAIKTNMVVSNPLPPDMLGKCFYLDKGEYRAKKNIKALHTVSDLRYDLYENGFYLNGIKYVRFKRSSGSSRVGKCLFIDERLYSKMHKWEMCGIKINKGQKVDLAALEAYIALTLSSIIDTIEILPENILVIDDYESVFVDDVIETVLEGDSLCTRPATTTIKNNIWDGQSIGDESLFKNYSEYSMLLLRNFFFKTAMFKGKVQQWFEDNNITSVEQLNGFTLAKDIKDIKLITTPSSIKYLKFGTITEWLEHLGNSFGIVKHEKPTHFFNGRMVRTHYQLLNTLQLSEKEMQTFLQPSLDYLKLLKTDPSVVRYHVRYQEKDLDESLELSSLTSKNDIVYKLLGINAAFSNTEMYSSFRDDLTKAYVATLRRGKVLVNGNYSTLFGNPIEMLQQSIGIFHGESVLKKGTIHSKRFKDGEEILGSRSPHVTIGNILLTINVHNELINKYFDLSNEVVCINSISECILDRLSGCDFDSDTMLLTNNPILINAAKKYYLIFKVPVSHVSSQKTSRLYNSSEKADLDIKTSENLIGEIINLSQELNTLLWDTLNNGGTIEEIMPIYYDICQLDVMSGIEIDMAKKEFAVVNSKELKKIAEKYSRRDEQGRMIKPNFFGHLARDKGYYNSKKKNYHFHCTSMDYLQRCINKFQKARTGIKKGADTPLPFSSILNKSLYKPNHVYYEQVNRVLTLFEDTQNSISALYCSSVYSKSELFVLITRMQENVTEYIGNLNFNESTMYHLLVLCDKEPFNKYGWRLLNTLFSYPNSSFFDLLEKSREQLPVFEEAADGNINVFDCKFAKNIQKRAKNLE